MEDIHEPLSEYRDRFKGEFATNAAAFFEELVRRSGVDEAANRETVAVVRALAKELGEAGSGRTLWGVLRGLVIALIAGAGCVLASAVLGGRPDAGLLVASVPALALGIWLLVKKLNPKIRELDERIARLTREREAKEREAWAQLAPLNRLYDWDMMAKIIRQTVPRLALDSFFSRARLNELHESFGLSDRVNNTRSVLFAQSGEINGNPFVFAKALDFSWGEETYTGSLTISWTEWETYTDSNGEECRRRVTRTQTLTASVTKPMPRYGRRTFLVYGNEAAPDLTFSRSPSSLAGASDGLIDKWRMKRAIGKLEDLSRNLDDDSDFTMMANHQFEAVFGATDRDHEQQFRVLFTPLAQQQMLALLNDKTVGYGDDFTFHKSHMINCVEPAHLANADMTCDPGRFRNYDLAGARQFFNDYANDYFRHFYFTLAPVLTIPLYQQHRSHGDIYKDVLGRSASFWEHESIANYYDRETFSHPQSVTENILKVGEGQPGEVTVTAYGFRSEPRVDYISMYGGDGYWHDVPVHWTEYLPVERTRAMGVRETEGLATPDFYREAPSSDDWQSFFQGANPELGQVLFRRSIASVVRN